MAVDRYEYSPSRWMLRCTGQVHGKRYFAKIFLADPYPVPERFNAPWEKPGSVSERDRTIDEQIAVEWEMTLRMRDLPGKACVPAPLGCSLSARTIVWEEAPGMVLQKTAKWVWWASSMSQAGGDALQQAGKWLRNTHDASVQAARTIELSPVVESLEKESLRESHARRKYLEIAVKVLKRTINDAGSSVFTVPVAFTHGDFCLSNLIWNQGVNRLSVVDFELSGVRPIWHDLFTLIAHLRAQLLNPVIPKGVIQSWERSFWAGYGTVSPETEILVNGFALSYLFQHDLPRLLTRRKRLGRIAGVNAFLYRVFFEPYVISRRLDPIQQSATLNGRDGSVTHRSLV